MLFNQILINVLDYVKQWSISKDLQSLKRNDIKQPDTLFIGSDVKEKEVYEVINKDKIDRLHELEVSNGWNHKTIHNKIQEITWDASANERNERHENEKVSESMNLFMTNIAKKCLSSLSNGYILDVGCGTGLIFKYMKQIDKERSIRNKLRKSNYDENKCIGVDLSSNMIKYAKKSFPLASFYQTDFLDFNYHSKFNIIIFNECLHYFNNHLDTIKHAISLCHLDNNHNLKDNSMNNTSMIIISHPKGYQHVQKLYSHNNYMVPSLLPTNQELKNMIDIICNEYKQQYNKKLIITIENTPDETSTHYYVILKIQLSSNQ